MLPYFVGSVYPQNMATVTFPNWDAPTALYLH